MSRREIFCFWPRGKRFAPLENFGFLWKVKLGENQKATCFKQWGFPKGFSCGLPACGFFRALRMVDYMKCQLKQRAFFFAIARAANHRPMGNHLWQQDSCAGFLMQSKRCGNVLGKTEANARPFFWVAFSRWG